MKLSTKGRYGLRAMVDIAVNSNGEHVALYAIAQRQNVSENYLEQVFSILRKAGLVKSVKGAQGGYTLADSPANLKVGSILRALEGEFEVVENNPDDLDANDVSIERCIKISVWDKMNESINKVVDAITLEDLVNEYRKMNGESVVMFYI